VDLWVATDRVLVRNEILDDAKEFSRHIGLIPVASYTVRSLEFKHRCITFEKNGDANLFKSQWIPIMTEVEQKLLEKMESFPHKFSIPWVGKRLYEIKSLLESELGEQNKDWQWIASPGEDFAITIGAKDATQLVKVRLLLS
jgi:hypothetical protein